MVYDASTDGQADIWWFLIADVPSLASALIAHADPYKPFLPLLRHSTNAEDPIPLLTSTFLTNLVSTSLVSSSKPAARDNEALPQLYAYLSTLARNQDNGLQDIGVQEFSTLLRTARARQIFWDQRKDTVDPLIEILRAATGTKDSGSSTNARIEPGLAGGVGIQLLYRVLLVLWQLTFEASLVGDDLQAYVLPSGEKHVCHANTIPETMRLFNSTRNFCEFHLKKRRPDSFCPPSTTFFLPTATPCCLSQCSSAYLPSFPIFLAAT